MILAEVVSPAHSGPWLLGAGPSFIFPTAHSDFTGDGKWQLGPAVVVGYLTDKFLVGAFAQHFCQDHVAKGGCSFEFARSRWVRDTDVERDHRARDEIHIFR